VIGRPGSTLWLLGHEIRLSWRGLIGGRRGRVRLVVLGILGVVFAIAGFPIALALQNFQMPVDPLSILAAAFACVVIFTLMVSQTLAGAADTLYARGDLDLLFSSPLNPRKTLTVRFASMAATAFTAFALLAVPLLIPLAIFGHWRWLSLLLVLGALAMAASGAGLAISVGLFAVIGPRRTRAAAQILAAIIGAAFFLISQTQTIFGRRSTGLWLQLMGAASDPRLRLPPGASWPLRAMLGEPLPLAAMLLVGAAIFFTVTAWLSRRFAADAASAQGADVGRRTVARGVAGAFVGGVFAATFVKELRLLTRDIALLAQVLLRVLYLLPVTFLLLRSAAGHQALALPGGAAAITFMAGQVGASLTWITVSAEEAPELLQCAPAASATVRSAKLLAGLAPLGLLLVIPLAIVTVAAPAAGLAATAGSICAAYAAGLINAWYPTPGKRSDFLRRRRSGSILIGLAYFFVSALIAAATGLAAAMWLPLALIPATLAVVALLVLRRSPGRIAEALAAQS
jgi:ABC-2 type transport system permease protein